MRLDRVMGCGLAAAALAVVVAGAAVVAGCSSSDSVSSASGGPATSAVPPSGGQVTGAPLLVDIDTNATLVQTPGNGIGVYVEYESGGHWNITWTCDTTLTQLPCPYVVDASVSSGLIGTPSPLGEQSANAFSQSSGQEVQAWSTTTTGVDGMAFDTAPGALLTVNVRLNAPVSFFFVQDGQVNGGYKGTLTNPLMFQPTSP